MKALATAGADVTDVDGLGRDARALATQAAGEAAGAEVGAVIEAIERDRAQQQQQQKLGSAKEKNTEHVEIDIGIETNHSDGGKSQLGQLTPQNTASSSSSGLDTQEATTAKYKPEQSPWPLVVALGGVALLTLMKPR